MPLIHCLCVRQCCVGVPCPFLCAAWARDLFLCLVVVDRRRRGVSGFWCRRVCDCCCGCFGGPSLCHHSSTAADKWSSAAAARPASSRASQPRVPEATDAQCLAWLIVLCVVFASCITRRPAMALCSLHGCVLEMMVTVRIVGACLCGLSGGWDGRSLAGMRTSRPLQMLALHQR